MCCERGVNPLTSQPSATRWMHVQTLAKPLSNAQQGAGSSAGSILASPPAASDDPMQFFRRLLRIALWLSFLGLVAGGSAVAVLYWLVAPTLPDVQSLRDVRLQVPMSVLSADGKLIATFGETRRKPVAVADIPDQVKQAVIAIEDARFYDHPGVDWRGVLRAVWLLAVTDRERVPGGSTITQQVAKMFFLSSEYSYVRKFTEMLLALKMERELSKDEILELYLNKSFFGNRAYGIAAAADFYYGKSLHELELHQAAMLAGIPKFPSSGNPLTNPERARVRRDYILLRMFEVGFIDASSYRNAVATPDDSSPHDPAIELEAPYVAEMVRQYAVERYGADATTEGLQVIATVHADGQAAANESLRMSLLDYDRRHGWRGPERRIEVPSGGVADASSGLLAQLRETAAIGGLIPALVVSVEAQEASLLIGDGSTVKLDLEAAEWARRYINENSRGPAIKSLESVLAEGDVVRVHQGLDGSWQLSQIPKAQAALVALDIETGAIRALTGGFSFALNKFNRAIQSQRQPGSSFKPFVYAAAFERGFTPASVVLDAPVIFQQANGETWRPQNENRAFAGPMRLREAMVTSRNLVSVRVLDAIGVGYARRYIQGFGFQPESLPENLSLALGTSSAPPLAMARGYAAFVNGGFLIEPYVVERVIDRRGVVIAHAHPLLACRSCPERLSSITTYAQDGFDLGADQSKDLVSSGMGPPLLGLAPRVVDERTTFLITSVLKDVVKRGTGRRALELAREDVGGKTGSTNDFRDAWFSGFGGNLAVTAWVGMDDFASLGTGELGGKAALPLWIGYMHEALRDIPIDTAPMPNGITTALIDPATGLPLRGASQSGVPEYFRSEDLSRIEKLEGEVPNDGSLRETFDIF